HLRERLKALAKVEDEQAQTPQMQHVHVIGGGVMGGDIAAWCALQGIKVTVQDQQPEALARVTKRAHELFKKRLREGRLITAAMDRLIPDGKGYGINQADLVIEAIFENAVAKQTLFQTLEPQLKPNALLATNTSSIPLKNLSEVLEKPSRLVGLHFFNPVAKMQLVEIVTDTKTAEDEAHRAIAFAHQIDRLPVPVKSAPGFLVNRVLTPYLMEAVTLLTEGVAAAEIDKAAKDFGMPMGPIELADTVGLDICLSVAENLSETLALTVPDELRTKVQSKELGVKTGQGFYTWKGNKPQKRKPEKTDTVPKDLTDRLMLRMLNEAVTCLREGVVEDQDLLDAGVIFGTGFAPFRGGPMHYIHSRGPGSLHKRLIELAERLGERFTPDPGWTELDEKPDART
ncbi:MAG: 3-hydroxyacyl-CoA dehydrogenase, partial [Gammaproteobacteria bacterium]|nr:3-hydroxyacyl-CoA dehydrogenase [Gammaproteobacteria bacterium]